MSFCISLWSVILAILLKRFSQRRTEIAPSCGSALARVGLGSLMETYGDAVPGVHKRDGVGNVGNLLVIIVVRERLLGCVRSVGRLDARQDLSPF